MTKLLVGCYNCKQKNNANFRSNLELIIEGKGFYPLICKVCKMKENNVDIECGTSKIIESQLL